MSKCDVCQYGHLSVWDIPSRSWVDYSHFAPIEPTPVAKPPLGVMPRKLWLEGRIKDLCDAIGRAADHGTLYRELVDKWLEELQHRVAEVKAG